MAMGPLTAAIAGAGLGGVSQIISSMIASGAARDHDNKMRGMAREQALLQMMLLKKAQKRVAPYYTTGLEAWSKFAQEAFNPEQSLYYKMMVDDMTKKLQDEYARRGLFNSSEYFKNYSTNMSRLAAEERERQLGRLLNLIQVGYGAASGTLPTMVAPQVASLYGTYIANSKPNPGMSGFWNDVGNIGLAIMGYGLKNLPTPDSNPSPSNT